MNLVTFILVGTTSLLGAQTVAEKSIPKAQILLSQGKLDLAELEVQRAIATREDLPEAHNLQGLIHERRGRLAEAENQLRAAIALNPRSAIYQHNLGNVLMAQKKQEAIPAFQRALALDPQHLNSHYMLGRAYGEQKRFDLAVTHLERVRKRNPSDVQALLYLSNAYFRTGHTQDGLNVARSVAILGSGDARIQFALVNLLIAVGQYEEAIADLKALTRIPEQRPAAKLLLANVLFLQRNYKDAIEELKEIATPGQSFDVAYYMGRCYLEMEMLDQAQAHFELARKHKPDSAEVYYRLGMVQFQKRDNAAAAQLLLQALKIDPNQADAWTLLGSVCLLERAHADAVQAFEKCVALRPQSSECLVLLGGAYLEDEKREQALEQFERALKISPTNPDANFYAGLALKKLERPEDAIRFLRTALTLDPSSAKVRYELAETLVDSSPAESRELASTILKSEPRHAGAYYVLGKTDFNEERYAAAVERLEHAVSLDPHMLTAYYLLGKACSKADKPEQSQRAFEMFRQLTEEERASRQFARKKMVIQSPQ